MSTPDKNATTWLFRFPKVTSISDFSFQTNISEKLLNKMIYSTKNFYHIRKIPKKNTKKMRIINAPNKELKAVQRWLLINILEKIEVEEPAVGFRKGINIKDNAERHKANKYILCMDIEDFFPSIHISWVYSVFKAIGYNSFISNVFARLCTLNEVLPQGASTSPYLSNIVLIRLDRRIMGFAGLNNITYTRYADDLVFSSNSKSYLYKTKNMVRKIISEEGLVVNEKKTRFMNTRNKRIITGLVISNDKEKKVSIGRKKMNTLRSLIFHKYIKENEKISQATINGHLNFIKHINEDHYNRLIAYISSIEFKKSKLEFESALLQAATGNKMEDTNF